MKVKNKTKTELCQEKLSMGQESDGLESAGGKGGDLHQEEGFFRQISELSPFPVCVRTSDGRIDYINPQFTREFGYMPQDIPTVDDWFEFAYPELQCRREVQDVWENDSSINEVVKHTFNVTCKDGQIRTVTERSVHMENGKTYMFFHDITEALQMQGEQESLQIAYKEQSELIGQSYVELQEAHKQLKESEERVKTIFDAVQTGIVVVDPETFTIVDVNIVAMEIFGVFKDQIIGRTCCEWICSAKKGHCPVIEIGREVVNDEHAVMTGCGKEVPVLKTVVPVILDGRMHLLESFVDITELKRAEAKLAKIQHELIETAREVGIAEVATGILHNVGNVVNSVGVTASSIRNRIENLRVTRLVKVAELLEEHKNDLSSFLSNDEKGQKLPAYISALSQQLTDERKVLIDDSTNLSGHVQHITEIINFQQSFSKTGGVTESIHPADLMEDALQINASGLVKSNVEIVREFEDLPMLLLDRHQVLQILTNMVNNAKWALSRNPHLDRVLTVGIKKMKRDFMQFSVTDNGVGINEENLTRIFVYGFTTKKEGHGFGLHGGAIAAKGMGGSLLVHSDGLGKGAEFILELPYNAKETDDGY